MKRTESIQRVITLLARRTAQCERHGEVIACRVSIGPVYVKGGYLHAPRYHVTFADGTERVYWLLAGVPTVAVI